VATLNSEQSELPVSSTTNQKKKNAPAAPRPAKTKWGKSSQQQAKNTKEANAAPPIDPTTVWSGFGDDGKVHDDRKVTVLSNAKGMDTKFKPIPWGFAGSKENQPPTTMEDAAAAPGAFRQARKVPIIPIGTGYISGTRKEQQISRGVLERIHGLEQQGLQTKQRMSRTMLTPRIITDVKESWDHAGNIKREMTHYIENIDGTKQTKKETVVIPAHTDTSTNHDGTADAAHHEKRQQDGGNTTTDEDDTDIEIISLDEAGDMIAASGAHLARMNQPKHHEDGGCYASDDGRSLEDDDLFDPPPGEREKHPLLAAAKKGAAALSASAAALHAEHDAANTQEPPAGEERRNSVQNLATTQEFHKQRLRAFYQKHNPSKLSTVTATLEKYVGREELVLEKLEHKYGDNPTHVWLTSYYTEHNPSKLPEVEATLEKYAGREEELFRKLEQKYAGNGGSREKKSVVPETTPPTTTTQTEHQARVERELQQLVHDIGRIGNPQESWCTFGDLFDDETVANYYEALVGTLKAAKKRNLIDYPGQFLLKGVNDAVVIRIRE